MSDQKDSITLLNIDSLAEALKIIKIEINHALKSVDHDFDSITQISESYKAMQLCVASLDKLQKLAVELDKKSKEQAKESI